MKIAARVRLVLALGMALPLVAGCYAINHENFHAAAYHGPKYQDPAQPSALETSMVESNDLITACNQVVGKILANPDLANDIQPPRYRISSSDFVYEGEGAFNVNTVVNLLRSELKSAAEGRVVLVEDPQPAPVAADADPAAAPAPAAAPDSDYVLVGRISDLARAEGFGQERYTQLAFEVVSVSSKQVVLSDLYQVRKAGGVGHDWKY
ncbi:MAG: hypothetical protein IT368_17145 [Candidatus Hydrogenedentes bacterium]|nr:hypothetical protein [Candidatus Hydrogenedentota bacterium]